MKPARFTLLFLLLTIGIYAQKTTVNPYPAIDKKALQLPDSLTKTTTDIANYVTSNFKTDKEKFGLFLSGLHRTSSMI